MTPRSPAGPSRSRYYRELFSNVLTHHECSVYYISFRFQSGEGKYGMAVRIRLEVPLLDLKAQHKQIAADVSAAVRRVLESQRFILGPDVAELEYEIASYCGARHAIACASGSDALLLALMALEIGPGDEVITSPFTFFATAGSIARLGARPVFVDIDFDTFNLDPTSVESAVTSRTKAIIPIHLFGQCADMDPINSIAANNGLSVIEDAAQAIGATYGSVRAGSLGRVAALSFYPSKNLGGAGDGGMMTTNDEKLAGRIRCLGAHGAREKYYHDLIGLNSRLDSVQAALLRVKLQYLDQWTEARRANARHYRKLFAASGLVDSGAVTLPVERDWGAHVYNQFVIRVKNRDALRAHLKENGVGTEVYYPLSLHLQPCFKHLGYGIGSLPQSEKATEEALAIPIYPELEPQARRYVVDQITSFYQGG